MTALSQNASRLPAAKAVLSTGQMLWRLIAYRPWLSVAFLSVWIVIHIGELAPRIMTKLFFDTLTGDQPYRFGVTGIVILVLVTRVAHIITIGTGAVVSARSKFTIGSLLRRNLLARILGQPGARAIPGSPGEALNTIRDDVGEVEMTIGWLADQIAIMTYTLVTLGLMIAIDARIALLSLIPLAVVILISRAMANHAERYRQISRAATARFSGALNEILGQGRRRRRARGSARRPAGPGPAGRDGARPIAQSGALLDVRGGRRAQHRVHPHVDRRCDPRQHLHGRRLRLLRHLPG